MPDTNLPAASGHSHVFLGKGHEKLERRTWAVIWLYGAMMALGKTCLLARVSSSMTTAM